MGVELDFDRGTILCRSVPVGVDLSALPGAEWDGRVGLYRAPARFYVSLRTRLASLGLSIEDRVASSFPPFDSPAIPELRAYQAAALDAWRLGRRRGVVSLPTGSGKTLVAVAAVADLCCGTLCLVPTKILLEQWHGVLRTTLGMEIGLYGDGTRDLRPVTVATFESAYRHMHELGNRFRLLIVDEVHHFGNGLRDEALDMSIAESRLGLTATPSRGSAAERLRELVGPTVFELGIHDLAGGFLAEFELVELRLELTPREREQYEHAWRTFRTAFDHFRDLAPEASWGDFQRWAARSPQGRESLTAWRQARKVLALTSAKNQLVGTLLSRHSDSRVLIFASDKDAVYRVARDHLVMPITADIVRAERAEAIEAFRSGRLQALVSARVLNEGFDVPEAEVGIFLGGALGEREHVQRIGRLLRPAPGKRAIVYELVTRDTCEVHQAQRKRRGLRASRAS